MEQSLDPQAPSHIWILGEQLLSSLLQYLAFEIQLANILGMLDSEEQQQEMEQPEMETEEQPEEQPVDQTAEQWEIMVIEQQAEEYFHHHQMHHHPNMDGPEEGASHDVNNKLRN